MVSIEALDFINTFKVELCSASRGISAGNLFWCVILWWDATSTNTLDLLKSRDANKLCLVHRGCQSQFLENSPSLIYWRSWPWACFLGGWHKVLASSFAMGCLFHGSNLQSEAHANEISPPRLASSTSLHCAWRGNGDHALPLPPHLPHMCLEGGLR